MRITAEGLRLIKEFEGFSPTPYRCPAGSWTIGFGHASGVNEHSSPITAAEAEELLRRDLAVVEGQMQRYVRVPLNNNQWGALASFAFNVGMGKAGYKSGWVWLRNGKNSTLLSLLNDGQYAAAAQQFGKWTYARGKTLPGLVRRREAERQLFMKPVEAVRELDS